MNFRVELDQIFNTYPAMVSNWRRVEIREFLALNWLYKTW